MPAREPAYMHSFALTDRYAILFDQPFTVNPLKLAFGKRSFIENYEWKPERGTRFLVIDRQTGELRSTVGGRRLLRLPLGERVRGRRRAGGGPDRLRGRVDHRRPLPGQPAGRHGCGRPAASCAVTGCRWTAGRRGARTSATSRSSCRASTTGPAAGATTATSTAPASGAASSTSCVKVDVRASAPRVTGTSRAAIPGEPVFVARPGGRDEDDGVLLSVVLDARGRALVPAGARCARPVRARSRRGSPSHTVRLPRRLPERVIRDVRLQRCHPLRAPVADRGADSG